MADTPENDKNEHAGPAKQELSEPETIGVTVPVPNNVDVKVKNLQGIEDLDDEDLKKLIEEIKLKTVKYVILNAPFKVRPVDTVP